MKHSANLLRLLPLAFAASLFVVGCQDDSDNTTTDPNSGKTDQDSGKTDQDSGKTDQDSGKTDQDSGKTDQETDPGTTTDPNAVVTDKVIMPDKYSAGLEFGHRENLVDATDLIDTANHRLLLSEKVLTTLTERGVCEIKDGDITLHDIKLTGATLNINGYKFDEKGIKTIHIKNCLFDGDQQKLNFLIQVQEGGERGWTNYKPIYVDHCEFTGEFVNGNMVMGASLHLADCLAHDFGGDAFDMDAPYGSRTRLYAYNGGMGNFYNGNTTDQKNDAHADFIQSSGQFTKNHPGETSKVVIRACRSDMIQHVDVNNKLYLSNAASYNDCDYGDIDLDIQNMWAQGGSMTYRFELSGDYKITGKATGLVAGCINMWGTSHKSDGNVLVDYSVESADKLLVGSVWASDRVYVSATNYTNEPREFKIVTDKAEYANITLEACPLQTDFVDMKTKAYEDYTPIAFSSFPFDRLYAFQTEGASWVKVYDTTGDDDILVRTQLLSDATNTAIYPDDQVTQVLTHK